MNLNPVMETLVRLNDRNWLNEISAVMCKEVCCAFHALWGVFYTAAGSVQLVAGIFFLLSLPVFKLGSNILTGACNVLFGVGTFMLSCFGDLTKTRSEKLLLLTFAALVINVVNIIVLEVGEWYFLMTDEKKDAIERKNLHDLAFYAHVSTSLTTAIVIFVALVDTQVTFCSILHLRKKSGSGHGQNNNETVSDIEYIIPRQKKRTPSASRGPSSNEYTQSWVFDSEGGPNPAESPGAAKMSPSVPVNFQRPDHRTNDEYLRYHHHQQQQQQQQPDQKQPQHYSSTPILKDNAGVVTVQVDPGSSEKSGDGNRRMNRMKSFSRTPSPAHVSKSSSSGSIPPIYECLERLTHPTVYKARLCNYGSAKKSSEEEVPAGSRTRPASEDKDHYASLMVELENSFVAKTNSRAVPPSSTSKSSTLYSTSCYNESVSDSADVMQRGSDAEFSKELEAALKLIQELESPNAVDESSGNRQGLGSDDSQSGHATANRENGRKRRSRRGKSKEAEEEEEEEKEKAEAEEEKSDSGKTLSGSSSLEAHGKNQKAFPVESQSTSGYNSPSLDRSSRFTPTMGISSSDLTLSRENGLSCVIRHLGDTAVISLFSPTKEPHPYSSFDKISEEVARQNEFSRETAENGGGGGKRTKSLMELEGNNFRNGEEKQSKAKLRRWRHFMERKRRPSLLPEVESAIVKSECLAFLTDSELKDRLNRTKTIHRLIEAKVHRQRSLRKADSFGSIEDIIDRYGSTCM